jgi:GntR family transcriptional regulator
MLSRGSPTPLYRQLKDRLILEVEAGSRPAHAPLPSEREWVKTLGVSRITVRQALSDLVRLGYLYSVPGKGFFVADRGEARALDTFSGFTAAAVARGEKPTSKVLSAKVVRANAAMAEALSVTRSAEVVLLKRLRLADGRPLMVQESWLPHALCPGLLKRDLTQASLFSLLAEEHGLRLVRAETIITARAADERERGWLALPRPGVVLVATQLSHVADGRPVEHTVSVMNPARHPLRLVQDERGRSLGVL